MSHKKRDDQLSKGTKTPLIAFSLTAKKIELVLKTKNAVLAAPASHPHPQKYFIFYLLNIEKKGAGDSDFTLTQRPLRHQWQLQQHRKSTNMARRIDSHTLNCLI